MCYFSVEFVENVRSQLVLNHLLSYLNAIRPSPYPLNRRKSDERHINECEKQKIKFVRVVNALKAV